MELKLGDIVTIVPDARQLEGVYPWTFYNIGRQEYLGKKARVIGISPPRIGYPIRYYICLDKGMFKWEAHHLIKKGD